MYNLALIGCPVMAHVTSFIGFCSQQCRLTTSMRVMAGSTPRAPDGFVPVSQLRQGFNFLVAFETQRIARTVEEQFANDAVRFVTPFTILLDNGLVAMFLL
jgi:hypothetical protein